MKPSSTWIVGENAIDRACKSTREERQWQESTGTRRFLCAVKGDTDAQLNTYPILIVNPLPEMQGMQRQ